MLLKNGRVRIFYSTTIWRFVTYKCLYFHREAVQRRLFQAARRNDVDLLESNIDNIENAHEITDDNGLNILHTAVLYDSVDVVHSLLNLKVFDLCAATVDGLTAFDIALNVPQPNKYIVRLLLLSDRDFNQIKRTEQWRGVELDVTDTIVNTLIEMGLEFDGDDYNVFRKFLLNIFISTDDAQHIAQSVEMYHRVVLYTFDTWAEEFPSKIREILNEVRLDNTLFTNGY